MRDQQQLIALLLLAGAAGVLVFITTRQPQLPPPPPPSNGEPPAGLPPGTEWPTLTPEEIAAHRTNGSRAAVRAVPFYRNEERWELERDDRGRLKAIVVHRNAAVAQGG